MQRVALLNGKNKNQDYDLSKILQSLTSSGVASGLQVTTNQVGTGYAFLEVTRDAETFYVLFENTTNVVIDTTGTKKVWIAIDQTKVDDGSSNAIDGSGIGTITTGTSYPASNYIPLASITSGVITDERVFTKLKGKAITGLLQEAKSSNIASTTTTDLSTATGNTVHITGTTPIIGFGTLQAGAKFTLIFDGILTLTYNVTSLILPTGVNIVTAVGDSCEIVSEGSGNWRVVDYQKKDGSALVGTPFEVSRVRFGGDGSDGDLTISSGTTAIPLSSNFIVKNYNNLTISGTAILDITGATGNGGIAYIRVKGNLNMSGGTIQMNGQGGVGGDIRTTAGWNAGSRGIDLSEVLTTNNGSSSGGGAGVSITPITAKQIYLLKKIFPNFQCGAGGAGGNFYTSGTTGAGGAGGGIIIIEVGGAVNFTSGIIQSNGANGGVAVGIYCGGGGGGGGGSIGIIYNTLTSLAGTIRCNGGNGGSSGGNTGSGGGGGAYSTGGNGSPSYSATGTAGISNSWGTGGTSGFSIGGGGGAGYYQTIKNTEIA